MEKAIKLPTPAALATNIVALLVCYKAMQMSSNGSELTTRDATILHNTFQKEVEKKESK